MLYPLSYGGALPISRDVSMSTAIRVNSANKNEADHLALFVKIKETDPQRAVSRFVNWLRLELRCAWVFGGLRENPATI